jgi:cardiolipin synthase
VTQAIEVDRHRVTLLRDGRETYPAMLAAIAAAEHEVLLEMYWVGDDEVGVSFRDALTERARTGVRVYVIQDGVGSFALPNDFWAPLIEAGGRFREFGPLSPLKSGFRIARVYFRDHRKILVVDDTVGFVGGLNLAQEWVGMGAEPPWRDDAVELRGPCTAELRTVFFKTWLRLGETPDEHEELAPRSHQPVQILVNRVTGRGDRAIRRAYVDAIHKAKRSVDIAAAYFLPSPGMLRALRRAARRGVRVRLLLPEHSDVPAIDLATGSVLGRLLKQGARVFLYANRVFHAKTAVFDGHVVTTGSHNLDTLSWRFNLECNVRVDDARFGEIVTRSFEEDLGSARELDYPTWKRRSLFARILGFVLALFRPFL